MIREMYAEIQKQTDKHSVSELCEIYGVSRSGYYKWLKQAGQLNRYEKTHKTLDSYVLDIHSHQFDSREAYAEDCDGCYLHQT